MVQPSFTTLTQHLAAINGRFRRQQALLWLPRGLLAGLLAAALLATAARLQPLLTNRELGWATAGFATAGLLAATLFVWLKRPSLSQQAQQADRALALQERLTTAIEIHEGHITTTPTLAAQQLNDTLIQLESLNLAQALPFQWQRRDWLLLAVALLLLGTSVFLNNPQAEQLAQQRAIAQTIADETSELETIAEDIRQNRELSEAEQEELLAPIEDALEALQAGNSSQEQAVASLSQAESELRELSETLAPTDLQAGLDTASDTLANNEATNELANAFQAGDLAQASTATAELAENLPTFNEETLAQLADALAQTADSLETTDQPLSDAFQEAANALDSQDMAAAQEALENLAQSLAEQSGETAVAQQAEAIADQLSESRQTVAEAGTETADSGAAQANGNPQPGEGGTNGSSGGGEAGSEGQSQGEGGTAELEGGRGTGQGSPGPRGGNAETVFVPDLVDLSNVEGEDIELPAECLANPAECGGLLNETPTEFGRETSRVPYTDVFGDYQDAANEALADDYIPLGLKGYVRDYFSSLEP